jgi:hypothetical protein
MTDYKALYEKERKKKESYCKVIKKQQQTIKELKEQNKFYKDGFAELCEEYEGDGEWSFAEVKFWIDKQNEEIEELKKENLGLNKIMNKYIRNPPEEEFKNTQKIEAFKKMLEETAELEEDDEDWRETWDIIEETLKINSLGEDIED